MLVICSGLVIITTPAQSQFGSPKAYVGLQSSSPGMSQSGHINVSGTVRANSFIGNGAGLHSLTGNSITAGTVSGEYLPGEVAMEDEGNSFTGPNTFAGPSVFNGSIGVSSPPSNNPIVKLFVQGRCEFNATTSGVEGILDIVQLGTGSGIQSVAWGSGGIGVLARTGNSTGYGLYADNSSTTGVAAYCTGWGSGSTGVIGSGGILGVSGVSTNGTGVKGTSTSGYGVEGNSTSTHGIIGFSTNAEAVVGRTFATNKSSVHGYTDVAGSHGGFFMSAAASGSGVGVIGQTGSAAGYGVQAFGRFMASGTKSFRIDHPLDPENKYLSHFCAEGPEPLNIYSGEIKTGANGYAIVELPDYFAEINRDPRIQLTVDDVGEDFVMVKVVGGISGNTFRLRTSKPGVTVYWEVKAVRNDLYIQRYGAKDVTEKPARERGTYQHPELYDMPESRGISVVDSKLAETRPPQVPNARAPIPMSKRKPGN